jgi:hypothetical protein
MLLHRAARDIGSDREFIDGQSGLAFQQLCQQLLLGIADDHAKPPIKPTAPDLSDDSRRRCVDSGHILPKILTPCTPEVRFDGFKQLKLPKVSSCCFYVRADDVDVEASPAGFGLNDL